MENALAMMSPVRTKKGKSPKGYSGAAVAAVVHVPTATRIPKATLLNAARLGCAVAGCGRPRSRTAKAAATVIQSADQANAPKASEGRCQPAKRTAVAKVALKAPAATANQGLQRDEETNNKAKASEVPIVACPLG